MSKVEIERKWAKAFKYALENTKILKDDELEERLFCAAIEYFGELPNITTVCGFYKGIQRYELVQGNYELEDKELKQKLQDEDFHIYATNSFLNIRNYLNKKLVPYICKKIYSGHYLVLSNCIIYLKGGFDAYSSLFYIGMEMTPPEWFQNLVEQIPPQEKKRRYEYVLHTDTGFTTKNLYVDDFKTDVNLNYNDDFPDKKIKEILKSKESGVLIFHGEPGTGKSSYIRHLIETVDKKFLYIDQSCFAYMTNANLFDLLLSYKDSIVILEDSEELVKKRKKGNSQISALLNLTDGLLADSLKMKFICTFNADIGDIDPALLRKGRLKIKYEMKKLSPDKVKKLAEAKNIQIDSVKSMTLGDVYNYDEKVDYDDKPRRVAGFNQET